jgi:hypothetical protein
MRISGRSKRGIAAVLAVSAADVGLWAEFAPRSFYDLFPLAGHPWVSALGPYNEHMTRDVGGLYLGLLVISAWVVLRPRTESFAMAGAGWLAFSVPHFIYHMVHLGVFGTADSIGNIVTLGGTVILAALLLLPTAGPGSGVGDGRQSPGVLRAAGRAIREAG